MLILTHLLGFGSQTSKPSQADYDTHAATRGTDKTSIDISASYPAIMTQTPAGTYRFTLGGSGTAGSMWGSSWGQQATEDSSLGRFILHALPSAAILAQLQGTGQSKIIFVTASAGSVSTSTLDRNGFSSSSYAAYPSIKCTELTYWDTVLGKAQTMNPYASTGPSDYTW